MDEPNAMFAAAGKLLRDGWDGARIERTLFEAKQRRKRRRLVRGAGGLLGVALLFGAWGIARDQTTVALHSATGKPTSEPSAVVHVAGESLRARAPVATTPAQSSADPIAEETKGVVASAEPPSERIRIAQLRVRTLAAEQATSLWRTKLGAGDIQAAYDVLRTSPVRLVDLDDYLLAADTARRAGDPKAAVTYLERALETQHTSRSAVAAFTRGRILLDELARPADAARAFAEVERRARDAPLRQDALAREVDAWRAAGELVPAKARASVYLSRYPMGDHAERMRRLLKEPSP